MEEAFGVVIFAVVAVSAVIAVITLFSRSDTYDQIGRGGIGDDGNRPHGRAPDAGRRSASATPRSARCSRPATHRRAARGEAPLDVEAELARLTAPAVDPALREEVRDLVIARNARREARGEPPLDVDAEIERQLRDLGG